MCTVLKQFQTVTSALTVADGCTIILGLINLYNVYVKILNCKIKYLFY